MKLKTDQCKFTKLFVSFELKCGFYLNLHVDVHVETCHQVMKMQRTADAGEINRQVAINACSQTEEDSLLDSGISGNSRCHLMITTASSRSSFTMKLGSSDDKSSADKYGWVKK